MVRKRGLRTAGRHTAFCLVKGSRPPWHEFVDAAVELSFADLLRAAYEGEGFDAVPFASFDNGVHCRCPPL
jgi:hypothetical protein